MGEPTLSNFLGGGQDKEEEAKEDPDTQKYRDKNAICENFLNLAQLASDPASVYRNRPIWCSFSSQKLYDDTMLCYNNLAVSRLAVHNFIGLLIHESTHIYFSRRENSLSNVDCSSVEDAALRLLKTTERMVFDKGSQQFSLEVLAWICSLSCELYTQNHGRPCMTGKGGNIDHFLSLIMLSPTVKQLIGFLDRLLRHLLDKCAQDALFCLFDTPINGVEFNWIWLHVSSEFSSYMVESLFTMGIGYFSEFVKSVGEKKQPLPENMLSQLVHEHGTKLISLSQLLSYLMRRNNLLLMETLRRRLKSGLDADISQEGDVADHSLLFVIRMVADNPSLLAPLLVQNTWLVTPLNLFRCVQHVKSVPSVCVSVNWPETLDSFTRHLRMDVVGIIIETVLRVCFDSNVYAGFRTSDQSTVRLVTEGMLHVATQVISLIVRVCHSSEKMEQSPAVTRFAHGDSLQEVITWSFSHPRANPVLFEYLHAVALVFGDNKVAEIITRYILSCKDEKQLSAMCAFALSVRPFFPRLFYTTFEHFVGIRRRLEVDWTVSADIDRLDGRFIDNLRIMMEWDPMESNAFQYQGMNPGCQMGDVLTDILSWTITQLRGNIGDQRKTSSLLTAVSRFLPAMAASKERRAQELNSGVQLAWVSLEVRFLYKSAVQLAGILRHSLLCIRIDSDQQHRPVHDQLKSAVFSLVHRIHPSQVAPFWKIFVISFTDCLLMNARQLFHDNWQPGSCGKMLDDSFRLDEQSVFEQIRALDLNRSVASFAHSGQLRSRRTKKEVASEVEIFRVHESIDILHTACTSFTREMNLVSARQIALITAERVCGDCLTGDYAFSEWLSEKDSISRHLEVSNKVEGSAFLWNILVLVAECYPCLWFAAPIVKALLATITNEMESVVDRTKRPSDALIARIDKWIFLTKKGGMLPNKFSLIVDMLPYISCHEATFLLAQLWRYFQKCNLRSSVIEKMYRAVEKNEQPEQMPLPDEFLNIFLMISQRHIAELGYIIPILFKSRVDAAMAVVS